MQIRGVLVEIGNIVIVSDKFKRRHFIVQTQNSIERFEYLQFELNQTRCELIDNFRVGDSILITFQLQGNKWVGGAVVKYYNTLNVWKIEKITVNTF